MSQGASYLIVTGAVWAALILLVVVAVAGLLYRPPRAGHVRRAYLPPEEREDNPPPRTGHDQPGLPPPSEGHDYADYRPYTTAPETLRLQRPTAGARETWAQDKPDGSLLFPVLPDDEDEDMIEVPLSASEGEEGET